MFKGKNNYHPITMLEKNDDKNTSTIVYYDDKKENNNKNVKVRDIYGGLTRDQFVAKCEFESKLIQIKKKYSDLYDEINVLKCNKKDFTEKMIEYNKLGEEYKLYYEVGKGVLSHFEDKYEEDVPIGALHSQISVNNSEHVYTPELGKIIKRKYIDLNDLTMSYDKIEGKKDMNILEKLSESLLGCHNNEAITVETFRDFYNILISEEKNNNDNYYYNEEAEKRRTEKNKGIVCDNDIKLYIESVVRTFPNYILEEVKAELYRKWPNLKTETFNKRKRNDFINITIRQLVYYKGERCKEREFYRKCLTQNREEHKSYREIYDEKKFSERGVKLTYKTFENKMSKFRTYFYGFN